ncbi:MAG: hypothetical protein ACRDY1_11715 [Acidimicrobiales bacterium]
MPVADDDDDIRASVSDIVRLLADPPLAVLMSAFGVDATDRRDLAVRGIAYLHKPLHPEHLLDAVAAAARRRTA